MCTGRVGRDAGHLCRLSTLVHHWPDHPHASSSLSLVSLLTDLTVVIIAVVGGGALLLFALGFIICFVKKK